jgi:cobalt/nickel transport system ATP-binding protein
MALDGVTFAIQENRRTAVVGANGAGKSTLVLHMNGLFLPESGTISYRGLPMTRKNRERMPDHVGVVFQDPDDQLLALTVFEDVSFSLVQRGIERSEVERRTRLVLQQLGIADWSDRSPHELSFGQKKLVAIAGVLAAETEVIVFDEPMAFLDPAGKKEIRQLMDEIITAGRTVVITTHDMQLVAEWADDCILMKEGRCLGVMPPRHMFADRELLHAARLDLPPVADLSVHLWDEERYGAAADALPIRLDEMKRWLLLSYSGMKGESSGNEQE